MDLLRNALLNVVLVTIAKGNSPLRAQSVVRRLCDAGHHIILFGKLLFIIITNYL